MSNDPLEIALVEARKKLDAAIEQAMIRPPTLDESRDFRALEKLVNTLAAKLGRDRVRRTPYTPRPKPSPIEAPGPILQLVTNSRAPG